MNLFGLVNHGLRRLRAGASAAGFDAFQFFLEVLAMSEVIIFQSMKNIEPTGSHFIISLNRANRHAKSDSQGSFLRCIKKHFQSAALSNSIISLSGAPASAADFVYDFLRLRQVFLSLHHVSFQSIAFIQHVLPRPSDGIQISTANDNRAPKMNHGGCSPMGLGSLRIRPILFAQAFFEKCSQKRREIRISRIASIGGLSQEEDAVRYAHLATVAIFGHRAALSNSISLAQFSTVQTMEAS